MPRTCRVAVVIDLNWTRNRHHALFAGIHQYGTKHHWDVSVWPYPPDKVAPLDGGPKYDGIIGRAGLDLAKLARDAGVPLVNVWFSSPARDVPLVTHDSRTAGQWAGEHLLARGFQRFAFLGFRRNRASREREAGFRTAIAQRRSDYQRLLVSSGLTDSARQWAAFRAELLPWVQKLVPPVGLFVVDDMVARFAVEAMEACGMRVPQDVAIVSAENEAVVCLRPEPALTSVDFGYERVGFRAAKLLDDLMRRRRKPPKMPIIVPPRELVVRTSTDAFAVDDPIVSLALNFIANECHRRITVKDVVKQVPASGRTLIRRFHETRGSTVIEEINRMRLERVKRLLIQSKTRIKQIARSCGFSGAQRLCEAFERHLGMTPSEYRQRHAIFTRNEGDSSTSNANVGKDHALDKGD